MNLSTSHNSTGVVQSIKEDLSKAFEDARALLRKRTRYREDGKDIGGGLFIRNNGSVKAYPKIIQISHFNEWDALERLEKMSLTELDRLKNLIADTGDLKDWIVSLKTQIHSIVSSSPHAVIDDEAFIKRYISRKLLKELRAILFPKTPQN